MDNFILAYLVFHPTFFSLVVLPLAGYGLGTLIAQIMDKL